MAKHTAWLLWLWLVSLTPVSGAVPSHAAAHQARRLLGPEVWSQVLRIENDDPRSPYPLTVYATVFELGGILWFYTGMDGTQSFSLHRGRLAEEKTEFPRLLQAIDSGFTRYQIMPEAAVEFAGASASLPEGCFIESVAALQDMLRRHVPIRCAKLLVYHVDYRGRQRGHTVLVYETDAGGFVIDRTRRNGPVPLADGLDDPLAAAREIERHRLADTIFRARWFPLINPSTPAGPAYVDRGSGCVQGPVAG